MLKTFVLFRQFFYTKPDPIAAFANDLTVSYISHLLAEGDQENAYTLAKRFENTIAPLGPMTVAKICRLTIQKDPTKIGDLGNFFNNMLDKKNSTQLKVIEMDLLLEQGKADEAFEKSVEYSKEVKGAFNQINLFFDAFKRNDQEFVKKVYKFVSDTHGPNGATLDLAFAMVMTGGEKLKAASEALLNTGGLTISHKKLLFFVDQAMKLEKTEIFEQLLIVFYTNQIATLNSLADTAERLCVFYLRTGRFADAVRFEKLLRAANYTIDENLSKMFVRARNLHQEAQKQEAIRAVEAAAD